MNPHVYHESKELIIVDKIVRDKEGHQGIQGQLLRALNVGVQRIYEAEEIWFYNEEFHVFESYKNKNYKHTLLGVYFEENGINLKPNSDTLQSFQTPKDLFVFNLKFR